MFVFVSHLTVPAADQAALERHFRERSHLVENCPGFLYLQLLRPQAGTATHTFLTAWESREAFRAYMKSAEHDASHSREPAAIMERTSVRHEAPDRGALEIIDGRLAAAPVRPSLAAGPDGQPLLSERTPPDPLKAALAAIALDAAEMLGRPDERDRVRICGSDTCSARFFDRSPAAARRWCSMAVCGNAAKARRHRARAAAAVPGGGA